MAYHNTLPSPQARLFLSRGIVEHIKQAVDPLMVVGSLGIALSSQSGNYMRGPCPIHGGDNRTSFSINIETGRWSCFSHMCHEGYSDILGLVQLSRRCNFKQALEFVAGIMGIDLNGSRMVDEARAALHKKSVIDFTRQQDRRKMKVDLSAALSIEEEICHWIEARSSYFYDRGYTHAIQDYFELGFHFDFKGVPRATIPIRDITGRFVAVDGRRTDIDEEPRYFMQPFGFHKGLILYHYHKARDYLKIYNGDLFIVEGYKACWSMVQAGILNTVACMGAGLMAEQPQILMRDLNLRRIIFVLDSDAAGKNGARRSKREIEHFVHTELVDLPQKYNPITGETDLPTDPSTLAPQELKHILSPYL